MTVLHETIGIYLWILVKFLFDLYVFYVLTTQTLTRASHFRLRAVGGLAAVLLVAFGAAVCYMPFGDTIPGRIAIYAVLFAATVAHLRFCFDEALPTVLFCCSVSYAAQNLCYKLFLIVWCFINALDLRHWDWQPHQHYQLIYNLIFVIAVIAIYLLYIRRLLRHMTGRHLDRRLFVITILALSLTVILCSVEDICFARLSTGWENHFTTWEYWVLRQSGNLFSVMSCAIVLLLAFRTIEQLELQREVVYLQHTIHQSELQYEISRDTIDLINIKCHDIRYKLAALAAQGQRISPEAMADLRESISIYDAKVETGNQLLDVLLTEKSLYCEQNGITFSCMADGAKLSFMNDGDLYCLFGNIIDNALEAVAAVSDPSKRIVNLVLKAKGDILIIQSDNYFDGERVFRNGLPVTTKGDKAYHGFGMRSIQLIVNKYGGELTTHTTGNIFHLNILLSLPSPLQNK